ncbi:protein DEFECTIVE IN MERISTEM SILENCING 3-like isoform X2 [Mercurialis annua]|uniref:protein DEFECTIVE IN MERISTEM SILENCING 3-like isoform X2 n=1 Tax=Mercurialis annua TaxID=3986 RepID=UPI00215DE37E|nr:protein DEFECTIVE IN MERISTEM SILENCING 3-like isoform X2 [Mercurialis annua]
MSRFLICKYHSTNAPETIENGVFHSEEETVNEILKQDTTAASIFYQLKTHAVQLSLLPWTKDVIGVVATLARVDNDNLNLLLSEYLGLETMVALVCRKSQGVKDLEIYDGEGKINSNTGLHGLGCSMGKEIDGRFIVICLEDLRPYAGDFIADDPQKKLDISTPKLSNGMCPAGFLDFAVNMINLDRENLFGVTANGHGLRETLFYSIFSRLQVYSTRTEMLHALPCITHGALSLDGGIIKKNGAFSLGNRKDVQVKFPVISVSNLPESYTEIEDRIRMLKWEQHNIVEDMQREALALDKLKADSMGQY